MLERLTAESGLQQVTDAGRRSEGIAKKHVGEEKMFENLGAAAPHPLRKDERVGELCVSES